MKKVLFSTLAIAATWFVLDFIIHGVLLADLYEQTKNLWRPMEEIEGNWWMHILTLACAFVYSWIWCCNISDANKNIKFGATFGAKLGLLAGLGMGFGMYAVMPIPFNLALSWFVSPIIAYALAGVIAASLIKKCECPNKNC